MNKSPRILVVNRIFRWGTIPLWLTLFAADLLLLVLVVTGATYFAAARKELANEVDQRLFFCAADRQHLLKLAVQHQIELLQSIGSRNRLRQYLDDFLASDAKDPMARSRLEEELQSALGNLTSLRNLWITTPDGDLIAASDSEQSLPTVSQSLFPTALNRTIVSEFYADDPETGPLVAGPIQNSDGETICVMFASWDVGPLIDAFESTVGLGDTGEVMIGRLEGTHVRFFIAPRKASHLREFEFETLPELTILPDGRAVGSMIDWRGKPVRIVVAKAGYRNWHLAAKLDLEEAYLPIAGLYHLLTYFLPAVFVGGIGVAYLIAHRMSLPVRLLKQAATEVAAGNLQTRVVALGPRELAELGAAFNVMATQLETHRLVLEQRVAQRTADLAASESELRQSHLMIQSMLDNMSDGIVVVDRHMNCLTASRAGREMLGYGELSLLPPNWQSELELFEPDRMTPLSPERAPLNLALAGEKCDSALIYCRNQARQTGVLISASSRPMHRADGTLMGAVMAFRDVTLEHENRAALLRTQERLQSILEYSTSVIFVKDLEGRYELVNPRAEQIFGRPASGVLGETDLAFFPRIVADSFHAHDQLVISTRRSHNFEETVPSEHGDRVFVAVKFPLLDSAGQIEGVCGILTDITQRIDLEHTIRESNERFELVSMGTNDGIWDWNIRTGQVYFSPRWKEMLGYSDRELPSVFESWSNRIHPADRERTLQQLQNYLKGEASEYSLELRLLHKDGHYRWILTRGIVLRDRSGNPYRMAGSHLDLTERKEVEENLRRTADELARSNSDLQQFAYVASHDLQEPLRMVSSYMELLKRRYHGQLDSDADDFIQFAYEGSQRMQHMVNALLTYARVGAGSPTREEVSMEAVLELALQNLKVAMDESHARLRHDPLPTVWGNAGQLTQLLQNLIGNAIKFRSDRPLEIEVVAIPQEEMWQFQVRDNGIGFEQDYAAKVFFVFQRLHLHHEFPGTGIGLALCKRIVEGHGGRIWVQSVLDEGSCFSFTLAAPPANQSASP